MERLIRLLIILQCLVLTSTVMQSCSRTANADPGIGSSAWRMAESLERIAKQLETCNHR